MATAHLIATAVTLSYIPVIFFGLWYYRRLFPAFKPVLVLTLIYLLTDLLSFLLIRQGTSNLWTSHVLTLLEIVLFGQAFIFLQQNRSSRKIIRWLIGGFVLFWIFTKFTFEPFSVVDGYTRPLGGIMLLGFAFQTLFREVRPAGGPLRNDPIYWLIIGIITYILLTLFFSILLNRLISTNPQTILLAFILQWAATILANLCYARGMYCHRWLSTGRMERQEVAGPLAGA